MRNKIAWKLTLYFAVAILVFAVVVGGTFAHFFVHHTIDMKKQEIEQRAVRIAEVVSENAQRIEQRGGITNSRFISYIDNITVENIWLVDGNKNLKVTAKRHPLPHVMKKCAPGTEMPMKHKKAEYSGLPESTKLAVEKAFGGKAAVAEDYNPFLEEVVVSAAAPVKDSSGKITAVILAHYPVQGLKEAAWEGIKILVLSCVLALVLVFALSVLFSWRFTKPLNRMKEVAEKMSEHDYTERCGIEQDDEIGELADTLDELGKRLYDADEAGRKLEKMRRDFIANISHELRTPVTVIRGSLEALDDKVVTDEKEVEEYYRQMLGESVFLQGLINDLLDLSRLQNVDFPIEKEKLNFCDTLRDAVRSGKQLGAAKNVSIELETDTDIYLFDGDYGRLRQMLLIFLDNAVKFSKDGGEVKVRLRGNRLTVTDYGVGVKPEDLPYVFDRFYKTRGETNKNGTGLGLPIAKEIAMRHKMGLSMKSISGEETNIILVLPPAQPTEEY